MVRVQTASRLHFGLLSPAPDLPPGATGSPPRRFGGVGLMVQRPGIRLLAEPADAWSTSGPLAGRALAFARRFADAMPGRGSPCRIVIEEAPPEHAGLGTGTQLGLAVGRALTAVWGLAVPAAELARLVGRGERSAVGVHGFEHGGFLIEGGQLRPGTLGPLVARRAFPPDWRVVLARPAGAAGVHGPDERLAMARAATPAGTTDALCRLAIQGMLPALAERDLDAFGAALFEFNARAGQAFAAFQGGTYGSPAVAELVSYLRGAGVRGVGQSSWGPTVFAVVRDRNEADERAGDLLRKLGDAGGILVTRAAERGASVETDAGPS
jgi:beta-RFAP synthase